MASSPHEFSPVNSAERFLAGLEYLADKSVDLAEAVLGERLPIDTICFFTHSDEEYGFVEREVMTRGLVSKLSHGPTIYVETDFEVNGHRIRILGVRRPDETRPQLGYGDYPVEDYAGLLAAQKNNPHVKEIISGRGKSLIELRHPDFDVLGFVVDKKDH